MLPILKCRSYLHLAIKMVLGLLFTGGPAFLEAAFAAPAVGVCEASHLSLPVSLADLSTSSARPQAPTFEAVAAEIARFRLESSRSQLSTDEKNTRDLEFRQKLREFEKRVGSEKLAKDLFQKQMHKLRFSLRDSVKDQEREEQDRKHRMLEEVDTIEGRRRMTFREISPGHLTMGKGSEQMQIEIREPFAIMDTVVTQYMWARLQVLMGETDIRKINPSSDANQAANPVEIEVGGIKVNMNPNHPVNMVSPSTAQKLIENLNRLSKEGSAETQKSLQAIIRDHEPGDVYDFPGEEQWEYVAKKAQTENGESLEEMIRLQQFDQIAEYIVFNRTRFQYRTSQSVELKKPLFVEGQPLADVTGNIYVWTKKYSRIGFVLAGHDHATHWMDFHLENRNPSSGTGLSSGGLRFIRIRR